MGECHCFESNEWQICRRGYSDRPAYRLRIGEFALESPRKGVATYLLSCGWPEGRGQIEVLAKPARAWGYAEVAGLIQL